MPEYHQAFSYIGALVLLNASPEDAYWLMLHLFRILPAGFHDKFYLQHDLRIFTEIVAVRFPKLERYFQKHQIDLSVFASGWIQGAFCAHFPFPTAARFLDIMFAEGNSTLLIRILVAFVVIHEGQLQTMDSSGSLGQYANSWSRSLFNPEPLLAVVQRDTGHLRLLPLHDPLPQLCVAAVEQ